MPIEIRELKISMTVDDGRENNPAMDPKALNKIRKEILEECIDAVSELLKSQKER